VIESIAGQGKNNLLNFKGDQFVFVTDNKLFVCTTIETIRSKILNLLSIHQIFF